MTNVIYLIRCAVSPKVYVGSTKHFVRRRFHHLSLLRSGRHHCLNLQRAFKKYGDATFSFDVVEHVEDPNFLHAREQFWLWRREGARFNSYPSAASPLRVKLTAKRRAQISVQLRGNTHRRGKKGSAAECLAKSIASMGNQHRLGILHSPADRNKIGAGLVRAYADGRHERPDLEMSRLNISKWNKALQAGMVTAPWEKQGRNAQLVAFFKTTNSISDTARRFGITDSAASKIIHRLVPQLGDLRQFNGRGRR